MRSRPFSRGFRFVLVVGFCALSLTGAPPAQQPEMEAASPIVIDIHAHFFNLRYLPIEGILISRGVPILAAKVLDRLLVAATPLADFDSREVVTGRIPAVETQSEGALRTQVLDALVPPDRDLREAPVLTAKERRALESYAGDSGERVLRAGDRELIERALEKARVDPEGGNNYFHFLATMMEKETSLVEDFRRLYPDVRLAVAHQMDLEKAYADRPYLDLGEQNDRLGQLATTYPGEVVGFVAFDPFRGTKALREVRERLESGVALGVKYYPPSGYRPSGNGAPPSKPALWRPGLRRQWLSRFASNSPDAIDSVSHDLFSYCSTRGIPVLAHCTPHGFQAASKYGEMADPAYWKLVLEEFPNLRLCLAHAGGGDSWFSDQEWNGRTGFDQRAWELATRFQNVYLDFSFANEVLQVGQGEKFRRRLRALLSDPQRPQLLADRVMWGSDWNIVSSVESAETILRRMQELFEDHELRPFAARFFAGNAVRFLDLAGKLNDPRWSQVQRDYWRDLIGEVEAQQEVR